MAGFWDLPPEVRNLIYNLLLEPGLKEIIGSGHRKSRRYRLSKIPAGPSTPLVCEQMQRETMDVIKSKRVTLRRVRFCVQYLTAPDLVSQAEITARPLLPNECPYGRNYEVQVEFGSDAPHSISTDALTDALEFRLLHILHILLHCHKNRLLNPIDHRPGLSVLYKPPTTVTVSDEENSTLECNFEGDETIIRAASIYGFLASRLTPHIDYIILIMFDRLK